MIRDVQDGDGRHADHWLAELDRSGRYGMARVCVVGGEEDGCVDDDVYGPRWRDG